MNLDKNIGWCTHTHNIATGCLNKKLGICNVEACYAQQTAENPYYRKAFPYGFEPHFYEERIHQIQKLKKPAIIFMDSMSDTFGEWWTDEQILKVLHIMDCFRGVHWHKYIVLTKNPIRMVTMLEDYAESDGVNRLKNVYFGVSVSGADNMIERDRLVFLKKIKGMGYKTVISMEPLLYDPEHLIFHADGITWADWVIVGGQTKPALEPPEKWVLRVAGATCPGQPLYIKKNCGGEYGNHSHDFPDDLLPIAQSWGKVNE